MAQIKSGSQIFWTSVDLTNKHLNSATLAKKYSELTDVEKLYLLKIQGLAPGVNETDAVNVSQIIGAMKYKGSIDLSGLTAEHAIDSTSWLPILQGSKKGDFYRVSAGPNYNTTNSVNGEIIVNSVELFGSTWSAGDHLIITSDISSTATVDDISSHIDQIKSSSASTSTNSLLAIERNFTFTTGMTTLNLDFSTANNFLEGTLEAYLNGIKMKLSSTTATDFNTFSYARDTSNAEDKKFIITLGGIENYSAGNTTTGEPADEIIVRYIYKA